MSAVTLHFWNWDRPVLDHAVEELTRGWETGALDLGDAIIVCPTAEAVRRLRQALAEAAAARGSAVMAPHVWHPSSALNPLAEQQHAIAPILQERMAWTQVLMRAPVEEMRALFPSLPESRDLAWASSVAETLRKTRHALGAGGHSMASAAGVLAGMDSEERWQHLVTLEEGYLQRLKDWDLEDAQEFKQRAARHPVLPEGVRRVLVCAVADAPPLFLKWLGAVPHPIEKHVFVHAPESRRPCFNELGVALPEAWGDEAVLRCPVSHERMRCVPGPEEQARLAVRLLTDMASAGMPVAIGTCDPALASTLEGTLSAEGARVYNPAGRSARQHIITQVLRAGWKAATSASWRSWLPFLRMDDALRAISRDANAKPTQVLVELDDFHAVHLPPTIEDAVRLSANKEEYAALHGALVAAQKGSEIWGAASCVAAMRDFLLWLYGERKFDTSKETDRHFGEIFGEVLRLAADVDAVRGSAQPMELLGQVLDALEEGQMSDVRGEAELVIHGWLELPWESAPGLVITGFNDEHVPGNPGGDPFLPDQARAKLGLSCQATRRARDAYLLHAMASQREQQESLHVILGRVSADNDSLRPSRLLLDASDEELPARVRHLFPQEEESSGQPRPARTLAFGLRPEVKAWRGQKISPSDLRAYLACPFRFYLSRVLRMEAVESGQREMSPTDFGSLMHTVLESFGRDPVISTSTDEMEIASWLEDTLDRNVRARHGLQPLFAVALQTESMRQRLRTFAKLQADQRGDGWRIIAVEERIDASWGVTIGDVPLVGTIDRVERHEPTGKMRIVDYKTSRQKQGPAGAHRRKVKADESADATQQWKHFTDGKGHLMRWTDLQLPLYVEAARRKWPDAGAIEAAYICLPATVEDIKLRPWEGLDEHLLSSAWLCAERAVQQIKDGIFWPPASQADYDAFGEMFVGDVARGALPPQQWKEVVA
jgi:ATP-dependent helicase/nuclease subunit B